MQVLGKEYLIGCDPEVFVKSTETQKVVNAHGLVPGDKDFPHAVKGGAVQVDGMALEFNTTPAKDEQEFIDTLETVKEELLKLIPGFEFVEDVSVEFDEETIKSSPEESLVLGCQPDFSGYTLMENRPPDASSSMRTVGGHVHVGGFEPTAGLYEDNFFETCARLARIMDEEVGVYSVLWDKDDKRRSMYGQAGAFRPKWYGMEYRTMSNAWAFKKPLASFVYNGTRRAIEKMLNPRYEPDPEIQRIINTSDRTCSFFRNNELADYVKAVA